MIRMPALAGPQCFDRFARHAEANVQRSKIGDFVGGADLFFQPDDFLLILHAQRTGVATPLTTDVQQHTSDATGTKVAITGTNFGFDFNPSVDRVRVVTDTGLNFRINPNTGVLIDTDADASNGVNADKSINGDAAGIAAPGAGKGWE